MEVLANRTHTIRVTTESFETGEPPTQPGGGFDCEAAGLADLDDPEVHTYSDPDLVIWRGGSFVGQSLSCTPNSEVITTQTLAVGTHLIDLNEFRFA